MNAKNNRAAASTVDSRDIGNFDALADKWWDPQGPMRPLQQFTAVRIDYIVRAARRAGLASDRDTLPLAGLKILDIGCGGGLLAEPCYRLGGIVTGIDASGGAVTAARAHSKQQNLDINYLQTTAEQLVTDKAFQASFDIIYASEVIEHVTDRQLFIRALTALLKPDGLVVLTTINKTLPALILAKIAAEYIFNIVPRGTHQFDQFVRPETLRAEFEACGILLDDVTGFLPDLRGGFRLSSRIAVNYGISGQFIS